MKSDVDHVLENASENRFWKGGGATLVLCLATSVIFATHMARHLPVDPLPTGDSASYLTLASYRPPAYGWLLNAFEYLTGGLSYLPLFQLVLLTSCLFFFATELGCVLRSAVLGALAIPLVLDHVAIHDAPPWIMTEALFVAALLTGLALQLRYARTGTGISLVGAGACFALAAATRTIGGPLLLLPPLTALLDRRLGWRSALLRATKVIIPIVGVMVIAAAGNYGKNGRFEVGSWGGMALLGKGLLLVQPSDLPGLSPPVAAVLPAAADHRLAVGAMPDLAARLRAQMQSYEDLRFHTFFQAANASWPAWIAADWRERGELVKPIAARIISHHPGEYALLLLGDVASLIVYPNYWPAWATYDPPDRHVFSFCVLDGYCWALTRYDIPTHTLIVMLLTSLAGTFGGVMFVLAAAPGLRRRLQPLTVMFWVGTVVTMLTMLATAAAEAGVVRYTVALHVFWVTLLLWWAAVAMRAVAKPSWLERGAPKELPVELHSAGG
jgi:hypothetical protein